MSEIHIADFSFKIIRKSSHFFRSIWNHTNERDTGMNVYHDYMTTNNYNYVNDFLRKRSSKASDLTSEQVLYIHEENNSKAKEVNNDHRRAYENPDEREAKQDTSSIASNRFSATDTLDMTPTNKLLDQLQIPPGERQKRLEILERQSTIFFKYLCLQIGTSAIVKTRRFIHNDFFFQPLPLNIVSCQLIGSRSEGLDMPGSDTDVLATVSINAYEKNERHSVSIGDVEYDSQMDNVPPGYVILAAAAAGRDMSFPSHLFHEIAYSLKHKFGKEAFTSERHGPASMMTIGGNELDCIIAIKSKSWPEIAKEWIFRKRCFGWPSTEMINSIVQNGCHIVPVGRSRDHANDKEWRLSFCFAEKELVKTFNHTQILVYGLLKIVLKEIVGYHKNIENLICSYFLKTILFWTIEESKRSFWVPTNIFLCFHLCFRRLIQFVVDENCPNYFVASNNMFEERFTSHSKEELLGNLCELLSCGWQWILQSKSLYRFLYFIQGSISQLELLTIMAIENEKVENLKILSNLVLQGRSIISSTLVGQSGIRKRQSNKFLKVPILRKKIIPVFCHFMDIYQCKWKNKDLYILYIFQMKLFTMDFHDNIISGKTLLSTWLYNQGKYEDCLKITDVVVTNLDLRIFHNCFKSRTCRNCHTFKQIINCCHDVMELDYFNSIDIPFPFKSRLILKEVFHMFRSNAIPLLHQYGLQDMYFNPDIYFYFLRGLCFHRLGDKHNSEIEYRNMMSVEYISSDHLKSSYQRSHIFMKLAFNVARYDIDIDMTNMSTIARSIIPHLHKLDLTESELFIIVNAQESLFKQGFHPAAVADLLGVPGDVWTKLKDVMKYVYKL